MLLHLLEAPTSRPKTFRYFNYWADCEGFEQLIKDVWATIIDGHMQYQVVVKLKKLKEAIKEWRKETTISLKSKVNEIRREIKDIHEALRAEPMNPTLHGKDLELQPQLGSWLAKEEEEIRQKS